MMKNYFISKKQINCVSLNVRKSLKLSLSAFLIAFQKKP